MFLFYLYTRYRENTGHSGYNADNQHFKPVTHRSQFNPYRSHRSQNFYAKILANINF